MPGMRKIDMLVLPLPYLQLLRLFEILFVFTLPFVSAYVSKLVRWCVGSER